MAVWPHARLTTYVATTPPAIKAFDLNAIQDAIIGIYGFPPFFGDGSTGAYAQAAGSVIATTNKYYTTFDLSGTAEFAPDCHVIAASQRIRLRDTAVIDANGVAGTNDGTAPGTGAGSVNQTLGNGGDGGAGNGATGVVGVSRTQTSLGGSGGSGGNGAGAGFGTGAAGGVASLNAQLESRALSVLLTGFLVGYNGSVYGSFPIQGGGGGGGGGQSGVPNPGLGGGGAGGVIVLISPVIDVGPGCIIRAQGGSGASQTFGAAGDNGGGGGGGGGGVIILVCAQLIEDGTITAAGGAFGISNGQGPGIAGSAGTIIRKILFP